MPWHNEQRHKRWKRVTNTNDSRRHRLSATIARIHFESQLDSGDFNTEVDLTQVDHVGSRLAGIRTQAAGFETGFQLAASRDAQHPLGSVGFGARKGEGYVNLTPLSIGVMDSSGFNPLLRNPSFSGVTHRAVEKKMGFFDDDPVNWSIKSGSEINAGDIWSGLAGERVSYQIRLGGGQLEPSIVINQEARLGLLASVRGSFFTSYLGALFELDWNDATRVEADRRLNLAGDDIEWNEKIEVIGPLGKTIAYMGAGQVFVPRRGGRADIRKRIWRENGKWFLFLGASAKDIRDVLMPGPLIIDPPISEEDITQNNDDASQAGASMNLSGTSNNLYIGFGTYSQGYRFQTIPIDQGSTINSATLEPLDQGLGSGSFGFDLFGVDVDDMTQFTSSNNDITGRTRTTASGSFTQADWPDSVRASLDCSSQLEEIVMRGGFASNNDVGFVLIETSGTGYRAGEDYNGTAANACDFNADFTAPAAGGNPKGPLGMPLHGPFGGPV